MQGGCGTPGQARGDVAIVPRDDAPHRTRLTAGIVATLALLLATPAHAAVSRDGLAAYLAARAAEASGEGDAVADYRVALDAAPASPIVAVRAWRAALAVGDMTLARRAAAILTRAGVAPMDVALLPLADAARADDPAAARAALATLRTDRLALLVPALDAIVARAEGRPAVVAEPKDAAARRLAVETRALLLLSGTRPDDGLAAVRALAGGSPAIRVAAGELLLGAGREADARALLAGDAFSLAAARAGATASPGLAWGVSRLLLRVAEDLDARDTSATAVALARIALVADPTLQRAHLVLADQLARGPDAARANAELDAIPPAGPLADVAAGRRVELLARDDRTAAALALAERLAEADDARPIDRARYADLLFAEQRPADALPWYRDLLKTDGARDNWSAWLRYGGALDEAGRWRDAEKALRRALALAPDEPQVLNYLGYTLADRRLDLAEGTAMLEKAHRLDPDDAAIADSLGWAYFKAGDAARALPLIEGAAQALPADTEVNDHLGDVYHALGRRYEARYAWAAALLTATAQERVRINAKLP